MKKMFQKLTLAAVMVSAVPVSAMAQDEVEASVGVDLVSGYIWRGQDLGGVSIQPSASLSWKGLSLGAWGSVGLESGDTKEFDLTLGYSIKGFSVSVTDYYFDGGEAGDAKYFHYGHKAEATHVWEAQVGYDFGFLAANWYTNIGGADGYNNDGDRAYSSYIALSAPFKLGGLDWEASVGATPWETSFYGAASGFAVTEVGLQATKSIECAKFSIPVFAKAIWNPSTEKAYFTVGLSL